MRVIITGGTGLIGRTLANSLAKDHHEVIVLSRNTNKTSGLDGGVKVVGWDASTAQGWGELADGAGAIVNLAGESIAGEGFPPKPWTTERKRRIRDSRIHAGKAVLEAITAAKNKPGVLIQSSAVGYYGMQGDKDLTEESPIGGDFQAQVCKDWEAVTQPVETMGVRRVVIRTGIVMTTKGGVLPLMALPFKLFAGGPIGSGKQLISWVHLDDEIAAIRFLMENTSASGAYNLSAPNPQSNAALGRAIARALGRPYWLPAPAFAFKLAFGELSTLLLDGQRVLPKRLLAAGFTFQHPEIEAALRDVFTNGK
ncbi:MAG: TIGR01777 family oxidoreductase [Anaerolineae bacterium]|nr:TIGR01777 family oxidoreductase [Anaerolineae bacterium]